MPLPEGVNLTLEICRNIPLPAPPVSEQQVIVDKIEALTSENSKKIRSFWSKSKRILLASAKPSSQKPSPANSFRKIRTTSRQACFSKASAPSANGAHPLPASAAAHDGSALNVG
jgi:hypothetical protein